MDWTIKTECIHFEEQEVKRLLENLVPNYSFKINQLVFYPYFFFEYLLKKKKRLSKGEKIGCTVDAINGMGALTDTWPNYEYQQTYSEQSIMPGNLNKKKAKKVSEEFLYNSILYKRKFLLMPELRVTKQEEFYRPYWIVESDNSKNQFSLIVDAVTSRYHPV